MWNIISLITCITAALISFIILRFCYRKVINHSGKTVPVVAKKFPLVGHSPAFSKDVVNFVRDAYKAHGKVFSITLFNKKMVVICDHELKNEYFNSAEKSLSLYDILKSLRFDDVFSDRKGTLMQTIEIVKSSTKFQLDDFGPKIRAECDTMIDDLATRKGKIDLVFEMNKFVARTTARCFVGITMSDEFYVDLKKFSHLFNKIITSTYFMPVWSLNLVNPLFKIYRDKMIKQLEEKIDEHRSDPNCSDSILIRKALEHKNNLSNKDIAGIIVCLMYVGSENTALGLVATLVELSRRPDIWNKVREETASHLNTDSLYACELLEAVVFEAVRLNAHIFAINRKPKGKDTLGGYYIGDADCVAICGPMIMVYDESPYRYPTTYNPYRFIGPDAEPKTRRDLVVWGAGPHGCPGMQFALFEIKTAVAKIVNKFEPIEITRLSQLNYFSPAAFADRHVEINTLRKIDKNSHSTD